MLTERQFETRVKRISTRTCSYRSLFMDVLVMVAVAAAIGWYGWKKGWFKFGGE